MPRPTLVIVPDTAVDGMLGPVLNPNNEGVVDVMAGTDSADQLICWLNPGDKIGDELIVRFIKRTGAISGGTDSGNRASIRLKAVSPSGRRNVSLSSFGDVTTTSIDMPAYASTSPSGVPIGDMPWPESPITLVIFKWSGQNWLPVFKTF